MQKGKQKELLEKEKKLNNLTWTQFALKLDLKFGKLNSLHYEESLIEDQIFNKLRLSKEYKKFILKELEDNWGRKKGGNISSGNLKVVRLPNKDERLAELWGILLGDGHIEKIKKYKIGVYHIRVTGHLIDDKDYLINFVKPLINDLFDVRVRSYIYKPVKALHIIADSRRIVDFFEENGFKSGNKIKNQVTIPSWIKENNFFLAACLRGLFDTDGSFYKLTNQNSYQVYFRNYNRKLLNDVREGLIQLGINVSRIMRGTAIVITKKSEIAKFYKLIGFSNFKHLKKIQMVFKAP